MSIKSASIEGLDELIREFTKLGDDVIPHLKDAANEAGQIVLNKTIQKVPVDTGNLKSKLKLNKPKSSAKYPYRIFSSVAVGKGAEYYIPLELGHKLIINGKAVGTVKAYPFLRPAADESEDEVLSIMTNAMKKVLDEWGKK